MFKDNTQQQKTERITEIKSNVAFIVPEDGDLYSKEVSTSDKTYEINHKNE